MTEMRMRHKTVGFFSLYINFPDQSINIVSAKKILMRQNINYYMFTIYINIFCSIMLFIWELQIHCWMEMQEMIKLLNLLMSNYCLPLLIPGSFSHEYIYKFLFLFSRQHGIRVFFFLNFLCLLFLAEKKVKEYL